MAGSIGSFALIAEISSILMVCASFNSVIYAFGERNLSEVSNTEYDMMNESNDTQCHERIISPTPPTMSDGNQTESNINPLCKKGGGGGHGGGGGGHSSGGHGSGGKGGGGKGGGGKGGGGEEGYSKSKPGPTRNVPRSGPGQAGERRKKGYPEPPDFPRGTIIPPRGRVKGVPPQSKTEDPNDETLNWKLLYAGYLFIHDLNPCDRYQERLNSKKNGRRKHGCRKEAHRMQKATNDVPSSNCPDVAEGRCYQVSGQSGRCYLRVNSKRPDQGNWELPDKCRPTSVAPPPPTEAPPPEGTPLQPAAQPPNQLPVPNTPLG